MKLTSFKRFDFTADLWTFVITRDSTGGAIYNYVSNRSIGVRATASGFGRMYVLFQTTESDVVDNCQLANFKAPDGTELRPGGVWQMTQVQPMFNAFGQLEGYKGMANYIGTTTGALTK